MKINHLAVWILVFVHMGLPALWYSKLLFAEPWMRLGGLKEEDFANQNPTIYLVPFVGAILVCYFLAWLFVQLGVDSLGRGALLGLAFAFIFIFSNALSKDLLSLRPAQLTMINEGLSLVLYTASGAVLGAWTKAAGG
jgi:small basic protein